MWLKAEVHLLKEDKQIMKRNKNAVKFYINRN